MGVGYILKGYDSRDRPNCKCYLLNSTEICVYRLTELIKTSCAMQSRWFMLECPFSFAPISS